MSIRTVPALALWLLRSFGPRYHSESLAGDLIEQYQQCGDAWWCWKQVILAIAIGRRQAVRDALNSATARMRHWSKQTGRRKVIKRLIGAVAATALGAGTLAWAGAGNVTKPACQTQARSCQHVFEEGTTR